MTKKDYEAIARIIRDERQGIPPNTDPTNLWLLTRISRTLASVMQADNPRFDRARFLAACRGEDATDSAGRKVRYSQDRSPAARRERIRKSMREASASEIITVDDTTNSD